LEHSQHEQFRQKLAGQEEWAVKEQYTARNLSLQPVSIRLGLEQILQHHPKQVALLVKGMTQHLAMTT